MLSVGDVINMEGEKKFRVIDTFECHGKQCVLLVSDSKPSEIRFGYQNISGDNDDVAVVSVTDPDEVKNILSVFQSEHEVTV